MRTKRRTLRRWTIPGSLNRADTVEARAVLVDVRKLIDFARDLNSRPDPTVAAYNRRVAIWEAVNMLVDPATARRAKLDQVAPVGNACDCGHYLASHVRMMVAGVADGTIVAVNCYCGCRRFQSVTDASSTSRA